jgi:integrase
VIQDIEVRVTKYGDRTNWMMYYKDPRTARVVTKSTGKTNKRDADIAARKWEVELRAGIYKPACKVTWDEAVDEFLHVHLDGAPDKTFRSYKTALDLLKKDRKLSAAAKLAGVDEKLLSDWAQQLRQRSASNPTIKSYLRHVRAFLGWCAQKKWMSRADLPDFSLLMPKGEDKKGRPITLEEFERILAVLPQKLNRRVGGKKNWHDEPALPEVVASWEHLLWGYWLSGLRLSEALTLQWDDAGDMSELHVMDLGDLPLFYMPAEKQKRKVSGPVPMVPEFAEFLRQTPERKRRGSVFAPLSRDGQRRVGHEVNVSKFIAALGKAANVVVKRFASGKVKYASAHDLRRSFCNRICHDLPGMVAKEFTRHKRVETLETYYTGRDAKQAIQLLNAARQAKNQHFNQQSAISAQNEESHDSRNIMASKDFS